MPHRGRGAELGPVPLHGRLQVEPPGLGQAQRAHRRERLADRVGLGQAAGIPGPTPVPVGVAAPQVHHLAALAPGGQGRAGARLRPNHRGETLPHRGEARVHIPLGVHAAIMAGN